MVCFGGGGLISPRKDGGREVRLVNAGFAMAHELLEIDSSFSLVGP